VKRSARNSRLIIILLLILAALLLSGCGVPMEGSDVTTTEPSGLWQSLVVWPLAKTLIWLNGILEGARIPYSWGFTIILFTFLIKVVTFPLTYTQLKGMQAQRAIQPRMQEIQKKYANDKNRLAQEQMKIYNEAGVNPLSGCLPLLIQMPILFGLYAALVAIGPNLEGARFFWIPDLAFPTRTQGMSWITEAFSAGEFAFLAAYLVLPILLMISQFAMQKWMTPTPVSNDAQGKTTQQITLVMTFMFGFFTLQVPAGLTLYWVTSNLLQMAQQGYMMRNTDMYAAPAVIDGKAEVKAGANGSTAVTTTKAKSAPVVAKPTTVKSTASKGGSGSAKRKGSK
jgi:YidC/Oxa1 family membrane protein insertase